jgi:hypothetical protein
MPQGCGTIQNMPTGDTRQFRAKRPEAFQAQRLGAKKRSKTEVSGEMSWFDEQNSQNEFTRFSPAGSSFKQFDRLDAILEGFCDAVKRIS